MNTFDNLSDQTFHSVIGRNVVDQGGEHIGTLDALWTDEETGKVEFLGVKTGWLFGKTHVVPVRGAEIHDDQDQIRVPYSIDKVKEAPSYPAHEELTNAQESEIYSYYGVSGGGVHSSAGVAGATGTTSERTVVEPTGVGGFSGTTTTSARAPIGETTGVPTSETHLAADRRAGGVTEPVELTTEEERLKVGTRQVEAGRVRLRKIVRTEEVSVPVELRREDVVVERVPADQVRTGARSDFTEGEVEMTVHREEAVVGKETVVTGAVRARKTEEVEHQTVSDTVRKEDVEVDRGGVVETARETVTGHDVGTTGTAGTTGTIGTTGTTGTTGARGLNPDPETGRTL
ncbi:MAG TPA: PRC and DUF2382 domain-containing protein [Chthoniobacterales bacterium]